MCTAIATSLLGIGSAAFVGDNPTGSLAFTNDFHYGLYFTLALAVVGVVASLSLRNGRRVVSPLASTDAELLPLRVIMKSDVYTLDANASLLGALQFLANKGISGAPVTNASGDLIGFISDGDILRHLAISDPLFASVYSLATVCEAGHDAVANVNKLLNIKVSEVCTRNLVSFDVNDELGEICRALQSRHLRKAPVMEDGKMIGIVNRSNISKYALGLYLDYSES